ncbi:MAG: UDP-N-acetylglucosamine 4,6-dehydratase (inverting) [Verrucomicrobia bacterium]|nr:UDP-N-acetylglucosamine 4,6-dehydratase (inverting) [Verrucomicrobiota bacterium]
MKKHNKILITGGTGSFGRMLVSVLVKQKNVSKIVVFSRDELKQFQMRLQYPEKKFPQIRFQIGDVRDRERLYRSLEGIDLVIHAAALKQVPAAEYNPLEAIKTNILGAANLIDAAIDRNVIKVVALSTDKACSPINLYGATKLCSDKLFTAANAYSGSHKTVFSVVRYGNVVGSRGSVIPYFLAQKKSGVLFLTDPRMTRFVITLDQAVSFVQDCLVRAQGGEIFVPKIPSVRVTDLARIIAPRCRTKVIGIRPGEKLHEAMISEDDSRLTFEFKNHYVLAPSHGNWELKNYSERGGHLCPDGFKYSSDTNQNWLSDREIQKLVERVERGLEAGSETPSPDEPSFFSGV